MEERSFIFYPTFLHLIEKIGQTDQAAAKDLTQAILNYGVYGKYESDNDLVNLSMINIKCLIDKAKDKYDKKARVQKGS